MKEALNLKHVIGDNRRDDEEIRRYIRSELDSDFRIYECTNGQEGLETILKEKPDLVISDVMMPRNGWDHSLPEK